MSARWLFDFYQMTDDNLPTSIQKLPKECLSTDANTRRKLQTYEAARKFTRFELLLAQLARKPLIKVELVVFKT